jgi:hypothetical protein
MKKTGPKIPVHNKRIALAVRDAARYASIRDQVLEEYVSQRPDIRAEMERLNSQGLDPTAWLNAISVPWLFRIDEATSSGKLLGEVFRQCELDHGKPRHWRILLDALVEQCFRGPGAPQKWDEGGLMELLEDIRAAEKKIPGNKRKTHSELARLLTTKKPFKDKYQRQKNDFPGFRKVIGRARNPEQNPAVNVPEGADWIAFRAEKATKEFGLPTKLGVAAQLATLERLVMEDWRQRFFEKRKDKPKDSVEVEWQRLLPEIEELARSEAQRIRET